MAPAIGCAQMAVDMTRLLRLKNLSRTVHFRTAMGAVGLISLALVLGAIAFDFLLGAELQQGLDRNVLARATDRAAIIDTGGDPAQLTSAFGDEEFVVIWDAAGGVIASEGISNPATTAGSPVAGLSTRSVELIEHGGAEIEPYEVRVAIVQAASGEFVAVGAKTESATKARDGARRLLLIGIPMLILISATVAWRLVGSALAPVDRLRSEVDGMAGAHGGDRVAVPPTGDELSRLAVTMNQLLDRIDVQRAAQRRFVADASHELKSPVANLRVLAETTGRPTNDQQWADLRGSMVGEAERMRVLVDDLLYLARSDEESLAIAASRSASWQQVHLDDVLFDEAERAAPAAPAGVRIDAGGVEPVQVNGDRSALARMARNLIENAARHANSQVWVAVCAEGDRVVLTIDDDGPGVPPEDRERIFERFTRLDDDRARLSGGTGLGLAIVARIVESHLGTVAMTESSNGGARAEVVLPA
ncbi:MAG: signal transduction histidine kinase [Candidatus Poriferisodalaceae bacterium]